MPSSLGTVLTVASFALVCARVHAEQRPAVIELFTSEGCSSCPPAEAYVGELAQRPDVLALSFHVDYWDGLGWRDRFGIPAAALRQRAYAKALRLSSVYTPQVVIDGSRDFVGNDRSKIAAALKENHNGVPIVIAVREGSVLVDLSMQDKIPTSEVFLIAFEQSAVSAIGRGENSGRTLTEYNIVRAVRLLGQYTGQAHSFRADAASLPADATDVAVMVQPVGQGPVLGAARARLTAF